MLLWQAQRRKKKKKKNEHVSRYSHTHTHTYTQSLSPFLFAFLSLLPVDVAIATPLDKHTHTQITPFTPMPLSFFFFCVCSFNSSVYNMSTFKKKSIHKHTKRKTNCGCALVKPVTVAPTLRFGFFFLPLLCCDYCSCCNKNSARESVFFFPPFFNSVCVCVSAIHRLHFDKLYFVFFFTKHPQRRIKGFRSRRLDPALLKWKKKKKKKSYEAGKRYRRV